MPTWGYFILIVAGAWSGLSLLALSDGPDTGWVGSVMAAVLGLVAFLGLCSALAVGGRVYRGHW